MCAGRGRFLPLGEAICGPLGFTYLIKVESLLNATLHLWTRNLLLNIFWILEPRPPGLETGMGWEARPGRVISERRARATLLSNNLIWQFHKTLRRIGSVLLASILSFEFRFRYHRAMPRKAATTARAKNKALAMRPENEALDESVNGNKITDNFKV